MNLTIYRMSPTVLCSSVVEHRSDVRKDMGSTPSLGFNIFRTSNFWQMIQCQIIIKLKFLFKYQTLTSSHATFHQPFLSPLLRTTMTRSTKNGPQPYKLTRGLGEGYGDCSLTHRGFCSPGELHLNYVECQSL